MHFILHFSLCSVKNLIEILGGSLLIASEGVCYMGNITKFKKQTLERLQSGNLIK